MAFYQFLCASMLMVLLFSRGGHSQQLECGQAFNFKTVGGKDASPGSWPWQVLLTNDSKPICEGSLIHNSWVMTAAQCLSGFHKETIMAVMGLDGGSNEVTRAITRIVFHPLYSPWTKDNGICLLELSNPVTFNMYIQPVCLASDTSTFHTGVISWYTGFRHTMTGTVSQSKIMQEVAVSTVGNNECSCTHPLLTYTMICGQQQGKDECLGNSGGPLVTKNGFVWVQSGILRFDEGCASKNPGTFIRVSQYQKWISMITGANQPGFVTYVSPGVDSDTYFICSKSQNNMSMTTPDYSVFASGESLIHFSHFTSLCLLAISLYMLVGEI